MAYVKMIIKLGKTLCEKKVCWIKKCTEDIEATLEYGITIVLFTVSIIDSY